MKTIQFLTAARYGCLVTCLTLMIGLVSCSEQTPEPVKEVVLTTLDKYASVDQSTGTIYIKDLPGSIGNTYNTGHTPAFFKMENHRIINPYTGDSLLPLPEDQMKSSVWDIAFTNIYNSYITINNGGKENSPGNGGNGKGKIIVIDALFDEVDQAPSEAEFDEFMQYQTSTGWEDFPPGDKGWYFYSLQSHLMSAITGITIIIKTPDERFAKIEMSSIYLGSPANPTVLTPAPYFTFRYFLQKDGSSNLKTR